MFTYFKYSEDCRIAAGRARPDGVVVTKQEVRKGTGRGLLGEALARQ